ncbi:methyl-accepting chemotaxis protein [Kineococcus rubinsiae]|uniref:methyl-accepting chemotaxis protein n=1 Tax=Kineococcus rubinsiae TaxID=2609562 RepID=UPI001431EFF5|nr:methyl-accepting chemotaxis protein [Kineococcus rubinsiae]NIZ92744.1 methyl-accepting chemotaxis protein [Kineococcus rubinsiae]
MPFPFRATSLRSQLVLPGVGAVVVTAGLLSGLTAVQVGHLSEGTSADVRTLSEQQLRDAGQQVDATVAAQAAAVQEQLDGDLRVTQDKLAALGASATGAPATWTATNQTTKEQTGVTLPRLLFGSTWLGQQADPAVAVAGIDDAARLTGAAVTVFQRMDGAGDMLRVATTVVNAKGRRNIGTYIPAIGAGGAANPVVAALLAGETYHGTATVADQQYVTVYEPLKRGDEVVGAVFVGLPQDAVTADLRRRLADATLGGTGSFGIFSSAAAAKGTAVVAPAGGVDGTPMLDAKDVHGDPYVARLLATAADLGPGEFTTTTVDLPGGRQTVGVSRYPAYDWVVTSWLPDADTAAVTNRVRSSGDALVRTTLLTGLAVALAMAVLIGLLARTLVRRIGRLTDALVRVADRDLSAPGGADDGRDEIGAMSRALDAAITAMRDALRAVSAGASRVTGTADDLAGASARLSQTADATSAEIGRVANDAGSVSGGVHEVSAAVEQLRAAADDVSSTTSTVSVVAGEAVHLAEAATGTVERLGESSQQIADVLRTITAIAAQTNLLALNATIEAARAGEAGAGFAVVAEEVKELARQTARATEEIAPTLTAVRAEAAAVRADISQISATIGQVDELQTTIASAVAEQLATTTAVSGTLHDAAARSGGIASALSQTADAVDGTTAQVGAVRSAVSDLAQVAGDLDAQVRQFRLG